MFIKKIIIHIKQLFYIEKLNIKKGDLCEGRTSR